MATETQIPEFVCLKSCETEDNAWSSELPGNKVKQLESVNTEVETGKLTNESGTFLQALSDPMVNAGQHSKIPESCEATTIQYQEEKKITEAVSTQTEAGKEETIENEEKNDEKATDRNGVTRSEDAVFEDIIKETMDGQDAATEFLKEEMEDKIIDAQKASEECEIGAKEKEEEKPEAEEEIAEMGPSVEIEEKLDDQKEETDSPLIKEVTVPEKAENQQEVNIFGKDQDATFAQDVTLEKGLQDRGEDNEQQVVKTKENTEDETEEIRNIVEEPEQIDVIPTDVYISTQKEHVQETTQHEETEDKSIDAQQASKPYEDGTNNNGEQKPEENVDKIVESCLKLEQAVEKIEESQLKTAELEEGVNGSQKENLENLSIKEVSEERDTKTDSFTEAKSNDDEDPKETMDGQDATIVADCKEQDLNEEPREFLLEESEVKLTHVQQASEECENEAKEKGEENPEDSVKKSEKEEEIAEFRPIVEETGSAKAENHEIVSKNEDGEKEQEQDVNAVTDEIIEEEAKVDAENQADKTKDKIVMKDEVISTDKASEECEIGAKEKEEEKPEETVEKSEQEEEIVEIGSTVEVEEKSEENVEKSDIPLVKEVTEETVSEVIILKKDDGDQEKEQEVNILEKEQGERDATFAQDHSEDTEQQVVKTKESIEEETEEIRNIVEKSEKINEEPIQETTENEEADDKSIEAQEASEQYEDGTNNKGEQEPVGKIVDSCLKLEQQEIKPTVEETQVKTAELEEEVNGSQKETPENLSIREISEERNTKTGSFTEAKSNDDEDAKAGQDATIVADFKEQDLNAESREFLLEETENKLTDVQEASEECENEAKDSVKKREKEEEIPEIRPIVEESGSEKAENQEVVNMLEKDEDEEKEQEVNILEKDQDVIPTDVCISTQSELKEETTEIEEKNDEEVIDGQTNKSEIPLVKELCEKELNENEIVSKNEDEEKEQNGVISSPNASNEDISIDAPEITEQYEDEANNKEEEEIGINKIVDSCSKVEQEEYTEELKPSVEESTELVEKTIESAGGQKENPSIKEETESENIKSETIDISDSLSKDKAEEKEQELNMSEQNQEEDNVTCSEEAIETGEKNDDNQEQSEITLVKETTTSEKVEFEQVTEQSDSFVVTELESNEIVKKEENLEKEQEQDVNAVTEELIEEKLVDAQEMASELRQPKEENVEEIQTCLTETISERTEDDITKTGQDLSHEDANDNNTEEEEEKMVVDGRTREIEISTLEHEPVEEQKCGPNEVSKENLTDLNETIAGQEDITVSNSLETSTEDAPIDDPKSVSEVEIPQVVPTSEECLIAETTVHVDEEKETVKEEISSDDNVPENLLIKDVSEEIESRSEKVELSDSLSKDVTSIEDLQTKNDDTEEKEPELVETRESVDEEEIKSSVEIEENIETKPSEEITEIGAKDKSEQKPDDTVNEPVNSCPEIVEESIKQDEADAENQADKTKDKIEMKDELTSTEKMSLELEQENVIGDVTKIEDTNDNTKEEEKIFETREIEISTLDHESVSKEKFTDLNETTAVEPQEDITVSDSLEISEKVKTESESSPTDVVDSVSEMVPTSDESKLKEECLISETTVRVEEEKLSTLAHEPETTAAEPQEDITVSDSLEPSTKDTFSSDKVKTESESLPIDDVESVEVVPTSDESNLKEDISETTGRVIEEKETVTESDEKTEIKQETSLEKAELEGLKLSDVDQQGLLDVITSSEPTESKEEKSEDIENDGQIKKAEIPLVEQVCEVTSLEVEDRSVECENGENDKREQIPEESVEENIKENEADAGDKTQDIIEKKDEVISMSAELEQPKEENVEAETITEKTEEIEDTNDNTTEEEKIISDEKTREFEISEHVEEQKCLDQVSKKNFTDLNETTAVETSTENTSNSDKEKTESESLSTNDLETVSEVQIPEVGPASEESNQKEECLVSATAHVTEHIEKEDTGDHKLDPETEILCPATQETSEPDETETKLDAENQVERTEGSEIKDEVITAVKVDEEIHACLSATKSESTEDEITKEDEEKCILDGKAREIEISTIKQELVEEKNSGTDEVITEKYTDLTEVETQEDITVSDSLETSTKYTLDSEKAKTESENPQKDDLEEQIPEVVPTLEESKVNKECLISEATTHVDVEKETVTLSDETTEVMQETSTELEECVKTKESVDEDTKEIKSSVETNEIEPESPLIKEVESKDSDSFNTKLDENEIVKKEEDLEKEQELMLSEVQGGGDDAQEASKKCDDIANDEIEQKPVENVIEENFKEDAEKKKDIEAKLDDKTEDRSEMKDEVVPTEKIKDEIPEKDDNLENAYDNTTKGELEYEPVEEQNADSDEEKLTTLNEKTAVGPTLTEDTSNSDKATAESEHLPINDLESVSQVQIPEIKPKLEDSATTDYHINETLEKSYITTEENMPQVDSACEKINIEEDVTQLKSTDDKSEMVQDVILNEEIAYSHPVAAEVAEVKGKDDHVDEALINTSLEDVATIESQDEKLPTRALESNSDVQTPEVIADSADPNEISSAPVKSDEENNDLDKEDKALTIENLELHDELKPTSEVTIEEQVNELKPQQEQSEKNIINDQTLESKLEEKDFEDGKEDIVTLAPEKQNEMMKNAILTNEVVVETENEKGGNEVKEDNSPIELEYTLTTNKKELENEVPNFEFEKKQKDDELISQVQTPESILKMEMKEEATNDTCEMVLLEDEKENISINEEAIHNQLPSDTNEVFQIEKLNSSRNETTEDPKSIAENLKLKDETFTDMKRSDEDSETVAAEVEILENIVTEEKIVKTDANKEKETLDEPHEDEAENLPEASIEKHDPEIKTKSEVAEIVPEDRESCSILTENLPEASKEITTTTEKIEKEIEVSCLSVEKVGEIQVSTLNSEEKQNDSGDMQNKEREVQESSAQNDKKIEDSLVQPSIEKEIIQDVVRNEEIEQPNLDKTFEFVNQETQKEQADEYMIPIEDVKSSTREFEIPAVMEATADKADNTEDLYNKTVEAEKGVINENKSKPTEEVTGIKQEPLELDAPLTLDTTAKEDLKISQKYVTDDLIKTSQTQPEIQKYDVTTSTVDKQSPTEPQENENNLLTNQIDAKPLTAEVEDFKATEPQSEVIKEEKKLSDENKTSESEVVENLIGQRELTLPKDQLVEKEKSGVKSDEENEEEDDDNEDNEKMGSDAPVMVEASKDMEVKVHKKSHNILSGVGSKVKHSIAKVKKAITGGKSSPKSPSPPPKERDQVIT